MYLDNVFQIWASFGQDYSTHTAVSVSLVCFLILFFRRYALIYVLSFGLYCLSMIILGYHDSIDIVSTILILFVVMCPMVLLIKQLPELSGSDLE